MDTIIITSVWFVVLWGEHTKKLRKRLRLISIMLLLCCVPKWAIAQSEHCDLEFFLWVEQPSIVKTPEYFPDFYSELADFVTCNAAKITFNKVIVRFIDPGADFGAAGNPWLPDVNSPFLQDLVLALPAGVDVYALPYVKEPQYPWTWDPGEGNSVEQAVKVINDWNVIINGIDPSRTIKGIAFDPEGSGIAKEDMVCFARTKMATYGMNIKVGLTLAGKAIADAVNWGQLNNCYKVDESYLQIYNLYTQCIGSGTIYVDGFDPAGNPCLIGSCAPSPGCGSSIYLEALGYPDPAQAVFDANANYNHTFKGILTQPQMNWNLQNIPAGTAQYIYPMFTVEAMIGANCMYPNTNDPSKCGQVDGFGTWTAQDFLRFVNIFSDNIGSMTNLGAENIPKSNYGIFQYAFIPDSWRPCSNPDYGCVLPVTWLEFIVSNYNEYVELTWKTANEENSNYFAVEHSTDGRDFTRIGQVDAAGFSNKLLEYGFIHQNPVPGINYYRIVEYDNDGEVSVSVIRSISHNKNSLINAYPNPFDKTFIVEFSNGNETDHILQLTNVLGRIVTTIKVKPGVNRVTLGRALTSGLYLLQVDGGEVIKIVKE